MIEEDIAYDGLVGAVLRNVASLKGPLFTTDAAGLYDVFLLKLSDERRPMYACQKCRHFVERFGGLAVILPNGEIGSALWATDFPERFRECTTALRKEVERAQITGVFYSARETWGVEANTSPKSGVRWTHLAATPPAELVFREGSLTDARKAAAEKRGEHETLERALAEFPIAIAKQALTLLRGGNLSRSEKAEGVAHWFVELHDARLGAKKALRSNVTWSAVAQAPRGFAHIRSTMIGTLLEDLRSEVGFEEIRTKWNAKMDPLQYMRPQAAPTAANIAEGERIIAALGLAEALERRFAKLEDIEPLWLPTSAKKKSKTGGGVFDSLKPKTRVGAQVDQPATVMTFEKFRREVLPDAVDMEAWVPTKGNFVAMVTATKQDAPPILLWDSEQRRNRVNWYVYPGGSPASQWGLSGESWWEVTALSLLPPMWNPDRDTGQQGKAVFFLLRDCKDSGRGGLALFPETLRSELRAVRATIEAFSRGGQLAGRDEATACGLDLRAGHSFSQSVRVTDRHGMQTTYLIDRWD